MLFVEKDIINSRTVCQFIAKFWGNMFSLLLCSLLLQSVGAYLPDFKISNFEIGDQVALKANQVTSTKTQIPFDYYDLPFCKRKRSRGKSVNLGERLSGDKETTSPYIVSPVPICLSLVYSFVAHETAHFPSVCHPLASHETRRVLCHFVQEDSQEAGDAYVSTDD